MPSRAPPALCSSSCIHARASVGEDPLLNTTMGALVGDTPLSPWLDSPEGIRQDVAPVEGVDGAPWGGTGLALKEGAPGLGQQLPLRVQAAALSRVLGDATGTMGTEILAFRLTTGRVLSVLLTMETRSWVGADRNARKVP